MTSRYQSGTQEEQGRQEEDRVNVGRILRQECG